MTDLVARAMLLWRGPLPPGDAALDAFRAVYVDPVLVNGVATPLQVLVDRARMMQAAIADLTHHLDELSIAPGRVAFAFRITGRHIGDLVTPIGTVAATGRQIEVAGMDIFEVDEARERVTGIRAIADHLGLLASLHAVTLTAAPNDAIGVTPLPGGQLARATTDDAAELLVLQRCCWVDEALANHTLDIAALHESLGDVRAWIDDWSTWCLRVDERLVGAVRARSADRTWEIGRLMVAPDLAGRGVGRWLLAHAEAQAPAATDTLALFTGAHSDRNIAMYQRAGYRLTGDVSIPGAVGLAKASTPTEPPRGR